FLSRLRLFTTNFHDRGDSGETISQRISVGAGMDGRWNSFIRVELDDDAILAIDPVSGQNVVLHRQRPVFTLQANPSRFVNQLTLQGYICEERDFGKTR